MRCAGLLSIIWKSISLAGWRILPGRTLETAVCYTGLHASKGPRERGFACRDLNDIVQRIPPAQRGGARGVVRVRTARQFWRLVSRILVASQERWVAGQELSSVCGVYGAGPGAVPECHSDQR